MCLTATQACVRSRFHLALPHHIAYPPTALASSKLLSIIGSVPAGICIVLMIMAGVLAYRLGTVVVPSQEAASG
jgi:hypothetical protein